VRDELSLTEALVVCRSAVQAEIIELVHGAADSEDAGEIAGGETISVYRNTPSSSICAAART
jgi:hypothetical protein